MEPMTRSQVSALNTYLNKPNQHKLNTAWVTTHKECFWLAFANGTSIGFILLDYDLATDITDGMQLTISSLTKWLANNKHHTKTVKPKELLGTPRPLTEKQLAVNRIIEKHTNAPQNTICLDTAKLDDLTRVLFPKGENHTIIEPGNTNLRPAKISSAVQTSNNFGFLMPVRVA